MNTSINLGNSKKIFQKSKAMIFLPSRSWIHLLVEPNLIEAEYSMLSLFCNIHNYHSVSEAKNENG